MHPRKGCTAYAKPVRPALCRLLLPAGIPLAFTPRLPRPRMLCLQWQKARGYRFSKSMPACVRMVSSTRSASTDQRWYGSACAGACAMAINCAIS